MTYEAEVTSLTQKGKERKRLTKQLAELVGKVCDAIATTVPAGTKVTVLGEPNLNLAVYRVKSNVGYEDFFMVREQNHYGEYADYAVSTFREPGESGYVHGDFGAEVKMASRDTYLLVANRLPEIVEAFEAKEEEIIQALREGFETLRRLAGE